MVKFSEPVFILEDATTRTMGFGRRLQAVPFVDVQVEPGDEEMDPALLNMTVTSSWSDDTTMNIDIAFAKPPAISASQPEDTLLISFYGPFFDKEDGLPIDTDKIHLSKQIPPQVVPGALTDAVSAAGDSLQAGSTGILAGNAVMNIFLQGSLNQVWGMINNLQIILYAPLI